MFCRNCGAQLTAAFCTRCGAPAVQPPPPVQSAAPQPSSQQPPPAAKTGSGLKVLFVVLGVMVFLGVLLAGTIWYGWHKVKQTVASQGIDLSTVVDRGAGRQFDACELLTKEDLAQILNLAIERSEGTGRSTHSTCRYYSSAAQQRGADEAAAAFKKLQQNTNGASPQPNKHVLGRTKHEQNLTHLHQLLPLKMSKSNDSPAQQDEALKNLETMVRSVGGAAAGTVNDPVLNIEVESENAKAAMAGFRLGAGLGAAVVGVDAKPEARKLLREDVQGIGDEAVFGPLQSLLMFRKGDVSVQIDARTLPGGRDTEIAIAQRIAAKL